MLRVMAPLGHPAGANAGSKHGLREHRLCEHRLFEHRLFEH
jgi:hypothetical protein